MKDIKRTTLWVFVLCGLGACAGSAPGVAPGEIPESRPFIGLGQQEIEEALNFLRLESPYIVTTRRDQTQMAVVKRLKYNRLGSPEDALHRQDYHGITLVWTLATLHLGAEQVIYDKGSVEYYLTVLYRGEEWLTLDEGPSLQLRVDGESMTLSSQGSKTHRVIPAAYFGKAEEMARYRLEYADLEWISAARRVQVALKGKTASLNRTCSMRNLEFFARFASEYLVPVTSVAAAEDTLVGAAVAALVAAEPSANVVPADQTKAPTAGNAPDQDASAAGASVAASQAEAAGESPGPALDDGRIRGKVTRIRDYGGPTLLIYIDIGVDAGLQAADRVDIVRDGQVITTIAIRAVRQGWAVGELYKTDVPVQADDAVVFPAAKE